MADSKMCKRDYNKLLDGIDEIAPCMNLILIYLSQWPEKHKKVSDALKILEKHSLKVIVINKDVKKK